MKVKNLEKILKKRNAEYKKISVLDKLDLNEIFGDGKHNIVLVGGDGTLNVMFNYVRGIEIKNQIYMFRAGTGNDFARSFKGDLLNITEAVKNLPLLKVEDNGEERIFLNGCGLGVDGLICKKVNTKNKKSKLHFFKCAIKSFLEFKKFDVELTLDGEKKKEFKKVWLCSIMHGVYQGGGMKMSPKSDRYDDELEVMIVHGLSRLSIVFLFPIIYLGWHIGLKRWVYYDKCKHVEIVTKRKTVLQYDGEVMDQISHVKASFE